MGTPEALRHLRRDPALKRVIRQVGPCTLTPARRQPYEALVRAIAHQQVHGRAAEAILGRFLALCDQKGFPTPETVLALTPEQMRACGLSANKVLAIRDIAEKAALGIVPTRAAARRLSDDALVERLVPLRGVGRWTVEMLLIFTLGRPDILPVDDFGVREGYRLAAGLDEQPKPRALAEIGEAWAPYRTTAAWYFWRAADLAKEGRFRPPQAI
ncbi:DNA-3-methyladenine glycosylase 2 family protein [Roseomonas sp. PWR1]|uniref:DNA-3-methyladenine glycosylase II n=1 Tax=Roseomonas nitratireducens TaxID=2820810 RepID=A0ABS4AU73_9PROT|nr:DNA-3-methyladenine glycosylase 2 family protein [Neoroseomonas nitratireducens]